MQRSVVGVIVSTACLKQPPGLLPLTQGVLQPVPNTRHFRSPLTRSHFGPPPPFQQTSVEPLRTSILESQFAAELKMISALAEDAQLVAELHRTLTW